MACKKTIKKGKVLGVPDGSGPYGRGEGPGKGKKDGSGLKKAKQVDIKKEDIHVAKAVNVKKGNVKGHWRTTRHGKRIFVKEHVDSRSKKTEASGSKSNATFTDESNAAFLDKMTENSENSKLDPELQNAIIRAAAETLFENHMNKNATKNMTKEEVKRSIDNFVQNNWEKLCHLMATATLEIQKEFKKAVTASMVSDDLSKKGPGSRGGKVIGVTKTGKLKYAKNVKVKERDKSSKSSKHEDPEIRKLKKKDKIKVKVKKGITGRSSKLPMAIMVKAATGPGSRGDKLKKAICIVKPMEGK